MITSLHSPHVEAVKALLGSRGTKERRATSKYVIEGLQNVRSILESAPETIEVLYYTEEGISKIREIPADVKMVEVSPQVMSAMSDTVTSQGVLVLARITATPLQSIAAGNRAPQIAYFWEIQDPGNAGTVIRAADAFGFDAVAFSSNSVDIYSPKVVRATAGSFWQIPLFDSVALSELKELSTSIDANLFITDANGKMELPDAARVAKQRSSIWIFGNEARGIPIEIARELGGELVRIPMAGRAESLNLATAAAVVMYAVASA
ncbi:MAG: hypothetical protein RLZZ79_33 [Actinomycetota bacterium]|jgi:TrmH family RNA methyltransferase